MPQFLGELDRLLAMAVDGEERELLEACTALANDAAPTGISAYGWSATDLLRRHVPHLAAT